MRTLIGGTGLFFLLLIGWFLPRWLVNDGTARYRNDAAMHSVAQRAYADAWMHNDNPIGRLLTPAARVVSVTQVPSHCPWGPGSDQPYADYQAQVRFYTVFAIPAGTLYGTCGGWRWARFPPMVPA